MESNFLYNQILVPKKDMNNINILNYSHNNYLIMRKNKLLITLNKKRKIFHSNQNSSVKKKKINKNNLKFFDIINESNLINQIKLFYIYIIKNNICEKDINSNIDFINNFLTNILPNILFNNDNKIKENIILNILYIYIYFSLNIENNEQKYTKFFYENDFLEKLNKLIKEDILNNKINIKKFSSYNYLLGNLLCVGRIENIIISENINFNCIFEKNFDLIEQLIKNNNINEIKNKEFFKSYLYLINNYFIEKNNFIYNQINEYITKICNIIIMSQNNKEKNFIIKHCLNTLITFSNCSECYLNNDILNNIIKAIIFNENKNKNYFIEYEEIIYNILFLINEEIQIENINEFYKNLLIETFDLKYIKEIIKLFLNYFSFFNNETNLLNNYFDILLLFIKIFKYLIDKTFLNKDCYEYLLNFFINEKQFNINFNDIYFSNFIQIIIYIFKESIIKYNKDLFNDIVNFLIYIFYLKKEYIKDYLIEKINLFKICSEILIEDYNDHINKKILDIIEEIFIYYNKKKELNILKEKAFKYGLIDRLENNLLNINNNIRILSENLLNKYLDYNNNYNIENNY